MKLVVAPVPELFGLVADAVREFVEREPGSALGLAAGRTMVPLYSELARRCRAGELSLAGHSTFLLGEFQGVAPAHPQSSHGFVLRNLVGPSDMSPTSFHGPDACADNPHSEAQRYEQAILAAGGIGLQLLGLGRNGHLGFNEPGSAFDAPTHVQGLADGTLRMLSASWPADAGPLPGAALTMGLGTVARARVCVLVATGTAKAGAVAAAVEGPVDPGCPASSLQLHPQVRFFVDANAASRLSRQRG